MIFCARYFRDSEMNRRHQSCGLEIIPIPIVQIRKLRPMSPGDDLGMKTQRVVEPS